MAKKLKYQLTKNTFVDNDIVRYSDAFKNLNASQINLFLFLCCLAKQQYDVEKDDETEGKKTGWSDEIKINMIDFCKVCGKKTDWFDMPKEKKDAILDCFRDLQKQQFTLYKSKRRSLSDGFESYNYLSHVIYKNNVLTISMDEKTRLFFMNYDCFFTSYEIGQVIQLKSETSKLLYIYLRSFWDANKKQFLPTSLSLDNFRDIVGKTGSYLEYKDLKRHVLEKAIAEINEKTDIIISGDYDVYRHLTNGNEENIKVFNYYDNVSGNFKYEFNLDNNVKYLKMYIKCDKGEIALNNLYLNSKKEKLDYVLIPNEMMYRFKDLFAGSTSTSDRITYYFDALKIATKSIKNFVIGTGGEGFNNIYEQVKTKEYSSTEVHSSFLQILVEAGIIGFSITVVLLVYVIIKSKNSYIKFAYLIFVLHSFVDLNFSYMLGIYVFGILIAILDFNNTKDSNYINKYVSYISYILVGIFAIFTIVLSLRAWFALYMNIPIYTDENLNLTSQIEVVNKNEKRVMLDPYEFSYRKSLDIEYSTYLDLLFNQVNQINDEEKKIVLNNEIKNVIENKLNNAGIILKNNKYNSAQIMYACKIYIDLFKYLRYMNEDCNKYINVVKEKMMFLSEIYPKDKVLENNINEILNQL